MNNLMFIGSLYELEEFLKLADNCIETVKQSENIRLIVLETWLFLDYSVRVLLISAIDGNSINRDEYDLKFFALPRSFKACLDLLVRIKQVNNALPLDPSTNAIKLPATFILYAKREHPQFLAQFLEVEHHYYQKFHPECITQTLSVIALSEPIEFKSEKPKYRNLSTYWLDTTKKVDDNWRKKALRLDKARNYAAHSFDMMKIAENMGYKGTNITMHVIRV